MNIIDTFQNVYAPYIRARVQSEAGASLVEYALLTALIAVVCIGAVSVLGGAANDQFENIGSAVGTNPE